MSTTFQGNTGTSLQAFDPSFGPNTPGRDLSAYMTSVNSIAILTPEHELELAKQYYYDDNVDAARQLVLAHLRSLYTSPNLILATACRKPTLFKRATLAS